jgi:hypothetical protein
MARRFGFHQEHEVEGRRGFTGGFQQELALGLSKTTSPPFS